MTANEQLVLFAVALVLLTMWLDKQRPKPRPPYGGAA
jgi:hypothetical protein